MNTIHSPHCSGPLNDAAISQQHNQSISQLFEAQVHKTPDNIAYIFANKTVTYQMLNVRANRLAHVLHQAGVGPNTWVGLYLERSPEILIAILAVLKAGGAFVPLEPAVPRLRLQDILKDARPSILLVQGQADNFEEYGGKTLALDQIEDELTREATTNLAIQTPSHHPFNMVYTSGSTGKPKGVIVPNRAVLNRLHWMWNDYPFQKEDVIVFHKSYALVASFWEYLGGLLRGIPTLILTVQEARDPVLFWENLLTHKVSYLHGTPSLLETILEQAETSGNSWSSLRLTTTSAEPLSVKLARRWCKTFPDVPLLNLYGSTECCSNVTVYNVQCLSPEAERVPIGKPFSNHKIYIVDENLKPVTVGETGEICVAGACLCQGYHKLPRLTREKFVLNPFIQEREVRPPKANGKFSSNFLFRTGDLACLRSDGTIELVGRKDNQVKIRGFRVELEEVEATLLQHDAIKKCVVSLHHDRVFGECLAAYVVTDQKTNFLDLRHFLMRRLPEYMIPIHFTHKESLPLTPTGKINRHQLPQPDGSWPSPMKEGPLPREGLERQIAHVLQNVLQTHRIGLDDYFLDLGLHSLLMVQVQNQLHQLLHRDIPITMILQYATIRSLAKHLSNSDNTNLQPFATGKDRAMKRQALRRRRR